jgi:methylenetetrahydrofolate reductase (NADPH)
MRIAEAYRADKIPLSYEMFPPKGELGIEEARRVLDGLALLDPAFVSVTYSAGGSGNSKRTVDIAEMGARDVGLTMMPHLTCAGADPAQIARSIEALKAAGIENVLALRGDLGRVAASPDYRFAKDLIPQLREAGFCVGAAAYPEGHIDCLDRRENVEHLKEKEDAGAEFFVSQLFFDNEVAYRFLDECRAARIRVPIEFGIMPVTSKTQVTRMVFMCGASLPSRLVKILARYEDTPDDLRRAGIEYAADQLCDLARHGVDGLHIYCMNNADTARELHDAVEPFR